MDTRKAHAKLEKWNCRTFEMDEIFFYTNISNKRFLSKACGKQVSGGDVF